MYKREWETAANHASQQIRDQGVWTCPCLPCQGVMQCMLTGVRNGRCVECGEPLRKRGMSYCTPAGKQKAYRRRRKTEGNHTSN